MIEAMLWLIVVLLIMFLMMFLGYAVERQPARGDYDK